MKALEKDRQRRYDTAKGFAVDVERYLNDEAISARPPSTLYLLSKTARKHKSAVITGGIVLASLLTFLAGLGYLYFHERDLRLSEKIANEKTAKAFAREQTALQKAEDAPTNCSRPTKRSAQRTTHCMWSRHSVLWRKAISTASKSS